MFGLRHTMDRVNATAPAVRRRTSRTTQTPIKALETIINGEGQLEWQAD